MTNKIILISLGAAVLGFFVYYFFSLTGPVTYTNTAYRFQITLPRKTQIQPLKEEGVILADSVIAGGIKIYLPSSLGKESNPNATSISDYIYDYSSAYLAIKIHSQSTSTISNWKVLKQEYSSGRITSNEFMPDEEFGSSHAIRYIFDNGNGNLIILPIANKNNEAYLDKIAASFKFMK